MLQRNWVTHPDVADGESLIQTLPTGMQNGTARLEAQWLLLKDALLQMELGQLRSHLEKDELDHASHHTQQ